MESGEDVSNVRVLMVDDDPFTRSMLASSLQILGCFVSVASSAAEALRNFRGLAPNQKPDVALLDLDLGEGPTGIDLANSLRDDDPNLGIVILSTYEDPRLLGTHQSEIPAGTLYLVKSTVVVPSVLGDALKSAIKAAADRVDANLIQTNSDSAVSALPDAQIEIMRLIALGHSNSEIARRQWMTESAVEKAVSRLCKNLGLKVSKETNQRVMIARTYHSMSGALNARNA